MNKIEFNEARIKSYAKIQALLIDLKPNSSDEEISSVIEQIPPEFLTQKEDLMIICELFANYARNYIITTKGNIIKIMERIMPQMKSLLQNESVFFWNIFGGLFTFKLWLYHEGLISIDQIISAIIKDDSPLSVEYFLPEIIEHDPELFEKEVKPNITCDYSPEYLRKFAELRQKHLNWLRNSNDVHDPSYREIETNDLRLSIKKDDVDTFQRILSNSSMTIDTKICESALENYTRYSSEMSFLELALPFNSINIIKFLILHDAEIPDGCDFDAVITQNAELIHLFEEKMRDRFSKFVLLDSIAAWNSDMVDYSIDNYDFKYIEEEDVDSVHDEIINNIINQSIVSRNFIFWEEKILPFLHHNSEYVKRNISHLIMRTFSDFTCFFTKSFMKYPNIDINYLEKDNNNHSFLTKAIVEKNIHAVKLLLENQSIDINLFAFSGYTAFQTACLIFPNIEILQILSKMPSFDINKYDERYNLNAFSLSVSRKNFISMNYIINHFPENKVNNVYILIYNCVSNNSFYCTEIILKYMIEHDNAKTGKILRRFKEICQTFGGYKEEFYSKLRDILHAIKGKKDGDEDSDEPDSSSSDNNDEEEEEDLNDFTVEKANLLIEMIRKMIKKKEEEEEEEAEDDADNEKKKENK